jgi:glycosyltransferase involved in cell wall biosynthesis
MKITLGTTYYNNPTLLKVFIKDHIDYVDELIVVDDGSIKYPITEVIEPTSKIRIFQVLKDYGFNSHGCRNLIVTQSSNDWIVLLDSDRKIINPEVSFYNIRKKKVNKNCIYRFIAHFLEIGKNIHVSVNDFLIHREFFLSAGGYDEELIGVRYGDRDFFKQLNKLGSEEILYGVELLLTRKPSIKVDDADIVSKYDKKTIDRKIKNLINKRNETPDPNKPILTFDWKEITCK